MIAFALSGLICNFKKCILLREFISICSNKGLEFLGVEFDEERNDTRGQETVISKEGSKVTVCVIPTDEELMIATDTMNLL